MVAAGIYRSLDGGATWQLVGLTNSGAIGRLAVDPTNPQHIFAAAAGQLYNHGGERGVYESTDGGSTWTQVLAGDNDTTGAVDLAIDPSNPNRVFAAMWDHFREPDLRTYGGVGSGVYRSIDGGSTWQRLTNGLPASSATIGRIGVALAASNPQRLYAIVNQTNGLFQGFYDPTTAETPGPSSPPTQRSRGRSRPTDGGSAGYGSILSTRLTFSPPGSICASRRTAARRLRESSARTPTITPWPGTSRCPAASTSATTAGPIDRTSTARTTSGRAAVSQPFTQFYSVDVSEQDDSRLVGGAQDNGVNRSYGGTGWNTYVGGDGLEALIDPVDQNMVYGCSQYGVCARSTNGGNSNFDFTGATVSSRRNWLTPVQFDPGQPGRPLLRGQPGQPVHRPRRALVGHQSGPDRRARPRSQLSVWHSHHGGRGENRSQPRPRRDR